MRQILLSFSLVLITSSAAFAASNTNRNDSMVPDLLVTVLPFLILLGLIYFFFRTQIKSPEAKLQQQVYLENLQRQTQHMERMEQLLERLVVALEERAKKGL